MGQGWLTRHQSAAMTALRPVQWRGPGGAGTGGTETGGTDAARSAAQAAAAARPLRLPQYSGGRLKMTTRLTILPSRTLK